MINPFETIETRLSSIESLIISLKEEKTEPKNKVSYLTRQEVSRLLKITLPTLHEYTKAGIIKGSRIGSRVLYLEENILESVKEIPIRKYQRR